MTATPEYYETVLDESEVDSESLTIVIVAGATPSYVSDVLGLDRARPVDAGHVGAESDSSAYAVVAIPGGVLAIETTGYADPSNASLQELSQDGRRAAVARSNIQAHNRFGCARDGELIFDDDEFTYISDKDRVPAELRLLFDLAWVDLGDEDYEDPDVDPMTVALAMAEVVTGLEVAGADLDRAREAEWFQVPNLTYPG